MNRTPLALIPALALLGLAPAAQAKTICVADPSCTGTKVATVQDALDKARAAGFAGPDRVQIGPGTFSTGDSLSYSTIAGEDIEIAGAGDATVLRADTTSKSGDWTVLNVNAGTATASLHDLSVVVPEHVSVSPGRTAGLRLWNVTADRLSISGAGDVGALLEGGSVLRGSRVNLSGESVAVNVWSGGASVLDSSLAAHRGVWAQAGTTVRRTRMEVAREGVRAESAFARVSDSVIRTTGVDGTALMAAGSSNSHTIIHASRMTMAGTPNGGPTLWSAASSTGSTDVTVDTSIVTGADELLRRSSSGAKATMSIRHIAVPPKAATVTPGVGLYVNDLITADPAFVNGAGGDFRLSSSSPLIDRPISITPTEPAGPADVAGANRTVDGNGDGSAVADLGAFEYQPPVPTASAQTGASSTGATTGSATRLDRVAPQLSGLRVVKRTLRMRLSEAARVTVTVQRRRGRAWKAMRTIRKPLASGRRTLALPKLRAGRYRLAVSAADAAGNRSPVRRVSLKVRTRRS